MRPTLRKDRLEPLNHEFRLNAAPSPLDLFPSKTDTISSAFFGIGVQPTKKRKIPRKLQDELQWLHGDRVDPDFGLTGDSQELTIRRAFRRIESSTLFTPVTKQNASLAEIVPNNNQSKRYVVVEESRLQELTKLEGTLRKEKELLGEQCGWVLSDFSLNPRVPIPATRLAVRTFCEQQMVKVAKDVDELKEKWKAFCLQNHYNKPHLYLKDSYLKTAPVSQRALKLRLVRSAVETWRLRLDRDSMLFEDDLSFLTGKYVEAKVRQKDYERYYILAARYGPYSENEFNKDPRPGRRYFIAASRGAIKLQMLWDRYWSMAKLRRFRAARMIQKYYRRRFCYKKYHPIINLRLKIGKKTYYIYCWHAWLHYNHLCRTIKDALNYNFGTFIRKNFDAWKQYVKKISDERVNKSRVMRARAKGALVYFKFKAWVRFITHKRKLKVRLRRLFGFPHFDMWVQYVKMQKHLKNVNKAAAKVQSVFRAVLCRRRFLKKKKAHAVLRTFNHLVLCVRTVKRKRRQTVLQEFDVWSPDEIIRRTNRLNDIERQRLVKRQVYVQDKEKGAIAGLRKHLNSTDGGIQIDEIMRSASMIEKINALYPEKKFNSLHKEARQQVVARCLADECSHCIRVLESHNYNTKHPAFLTCPDIRCGATFTTEPQYHSHMVESEVHAGQPPQFSHFHMMLRHQRGQDLLRSYLTRLHGITGPVAYLDAWFAIQEWKKLATTHETFESKAMNIIELYCTADSARHLDMTFPGAERITTIHQAVKHREHKGLYRKTRATAGIIRNLIGIQGKDYFEFTTEGVLPPDVFHQLEWHCFMKVFTALESDVRFKRSNEYGTYAQLHVVDKAHRQEELVKDYERYRLMLIQQWTRGFCAEEKAMLDKANEIVDIYMKREIDLIYRTIEKQTVRERVREIRHAEQEKHEGTKLLTEDVVFWTEDSLLDEMYEHYTTALINKMLDMPELRKGLMQYSGHIKAQSRHMHVEIQPPSGKNKQEEWFTELMDNARKSEKGALPVNAQESVIIIQRRMRGVLGRKIGRKKFMTRYVKLFDSYSNCAYYQNNLTGESSWERPRMTKHLYHKSNW